MTRFEIDDEYAAKWEVQTVGRRGRHDELWIPSEELDEFNSHIIGKIEVVAQFVGDGFVGEIDTKSALSPLKKSS